ncbi:MAG TPA: hypothetical protein VN035_11675, partial [Microbacterium sp.]|nr:hypothetical protein [Microbacterium sp.]
MPAVLPLVLITVNGHGDLSVTVDGVPFEPDPYAPLWRRGDFARLLDQITDQRRSAVRVEVHESDGTVFTDIIAPTRRPTTETADPTPPAQAAE